MKKRLYFFESNLAMDKTYYLPYVSGLLTAYAKTFPILKESYSFEEFIFMRDTPKNMADKIIDPFAVAFSVCIWNHQLSLAVAKLVKERYPACHIIFGGPQVLKSDKEKYKFIDYIVMHEGEKQFVPLLGELIREKIEVPTDYNLDDYPSPYVEGLYDNIIDNNPEYTFQAILETDRNCPFFCAFCYWGQATESKKIKFHSLDYVRTEADWIGRKGIKYVFLANANYGSFKPDYEIAQIFCDVKKKYGYPDKIRVCYGKNQEERVFEVAKLLHSAGLAKAVTLARQSNSQVALDNIKRTNIKLSVYDNLRDRYAAEGMSTYTEIILGLPGETPESFKKGVEEIVGSPTQLFIYHCSVLPNTEMAKPEYIAKHGIKTVRVPLAEIHCEIRNPEHIVEYEDLIIETNTMTKEEWIECAVYSWVTQLKYSFGTESTPEIEKEFYRIARSVTNGESRGQEDRRFGNIYWEPEEHAFLKESLRNGTIDREYDGDMKLYAKEVVLWGRKSRVQKIEIKIGE